MMFSVTKRYFVFFMVFFLFGIPSPAMGNTKAAWAYVGAIFIMTRYVAVRVFIHPREFMWQSADADASEFLSLIDYLELFSHTFVLLFVPFISFLQYKLQLRIFRQFDEIEKKVLIRKIKILPNLFVALYFIKHIVLSYIGFAKILLLILNCSQAVYVFSSIFQLLMTRNLLDCSRDVKNFDNKCIYDKLKDIDAIHQVQVDLKNFFGIFQLMEYVLLEIFMTMSVYFIFYRSTLDNWDPNIAKFAAIMFVLAYGPYLVTFVGWQSCNNAAEEVSAVMRMRTKL